MLYTPNTGKAFILVAHSILQRMTGYYDIVLALIPVALVGITVSLTVVGLSISTAVPVAAVVASLLIGHAMFINSPVEHTEETPAHQRLNAD